MYVLIQNFFLVAIFDSSLFFGLLDFSYFYWVKRLVLNSSRLHLALLFVVSVTFLPTVFKGLLNSPFIVEVFHTDFDPIGRALHRKLREPLAPVKVVRNQVEVLLSFVVNKMLLESLNYRIFPSLIEILKIGTVLWSKILESFARFVGVAMVLIIAHNIAWR